MARTTIQAVAGILAGNYDQVTGLQSFIDAASSIVDDAVTNDEDGVLTSTKTELMELWLAAHFYHCYDPIYQSKNTLKSSGQFQGQSAMGLDGSRYGQMAKELDPSGYLSANDQKSIMTLFWGGLPPSDQTAYVDRD